MLKEANDTLEMRVAERTAELEAANILLRDSRRAALNMMEDAEAARRKAEAMSVELRHESNERKQAEERIRAMNDDLERMVERRTRELEETQSQYLHAEKLAAIGKLSASIAHEFNNPLQGIMSILKGLKKRAIMDEEDRELLEAAIVESDRMKNLIRSLQDFNRPSSGRKTMMDVQKSIDSLLLLSKSDFRSKRISVILNHAEHLPQILAVQDQIKQVFLNLLTNAADACLQTGGVITISTRQEGERVAVAIKDTGIGIKPEHMELLFQPFYTTKPEVKGTGLGLSVCHGIVQGHQGEIRVESWPGEGSTFTVLLPVKGE
jgi:signal transduction histidine kinase